MAKAKTLYVCRECGFETPKWSGRCPSCGEWNCLEEEVRTVSKSAAPAARRNVAVSRLSDLNGQDEPRIKTGMNELDRVLGGGIVPGGLMLIGGDPGIGKSTLLLQL